MTITLGWWLLPAFVTLVTWYWAACRPLPADRIGEAVMLAFRITVSIIVTLAVWLLYLLAYVVLE